MSNLLGTSILKFDSKQALEAIEREMELDDFSLKHLGISARILQHWADMGILPNKTREADQNHKFNFVDLVWIKTVIELRLLGLSLTKIKRAKENLLKERTLAELFGIKDPDHLAAIIDKKNGWASQEIVTNLFNRKFSGLKLFSLAFIMSRSTSIIKVLNTGEATILSNDIDVDPEARELVDTNSSISIPMLTIFRQLMADVRYQDFLSRVHFFNSKEKQILDIIRRGDAQSIIIHFKKGDPYIVEVKKAVNVLSEARLSEILLKGGYEELTITTQDGKITFSNTVVKQKLK